jgi:hypothetical protein
MPSWKPPTDKLSSSAGEKPYVIPSTALWAISYFSGVLGEVTSTSDGCAAWVSRDRADGKNDYIADIRWDEGGVRALVAPETDAEWKQAYELIGYCSYQGIAWEAP